MRMCACACRRGEWIELRAEQICAHVRTHGRARPAGGADRDEAAGGARAEHGAQPTEEQLAGLKTSVYEVVGYDVGAHVRT